jgi:tetratricopeptide (TPR) repeat protein
MDRFFEELKRRNLFRVAIAYLVVAWLVLQIGDALAPALHLPDWVNSLVAFLLILGFPIAIFFAWAYELTPEGIKREEEVDRSASIMQVTGRKLDFVIIGVLAVVVVFFAVDKFVLTPGSISSDPETQASDGYHLWSQTYDRDLKDIFAIQEETAIAVANALSITLAVGDIDFGAGGTRNLEAYDAALAAGPLILQQGAENVARAIELLEKAVRLDPNYAGGWSLLSVAYFNAGTLWMSERWALPGKNRHITARQSSQR